MSTTTDPDTNTPPLREFLEFCLKKIFEDLAKMLEDEHYVDTTGDAKYIIDFLTNRPQIHHFRTESGTTERFYKVWLEIRELSLNGFLDTGLYLQGKEGHGRILRILDSIEDAQMHDYEGENDTSTPAEREWIDKAMQRLGYLD